MMTLAQFEKQYTALQGKRMKALQKVNTADVKLADAKYVLETVEEEIAKFIAKTLDSIPEALTEKKA